MRHALSPSLRRLAALVASAAFLGLVDARDGVSFGLSLNPLDMLANANVTVPMFEAGAAQHLDSAARHGRGRGVGLADLGAARLTWAQGRMQAMLNLLLKLLALCLVVALSASLPGSGPGGMSAGVVILLGLAAAALFIAIDHLPQLAALRARWSRLRWNPSGFVSYACAFVLVLNSHGILGRVADQGRQPSAAQLISFLLTLALLVYTELRRPAATPESTGAH